MLDDFINTVLESAMEIKKLLDTKQDYLYAKHGIGAGGDRSIGADLESEKIFINKLSRFGNIDSEESGFIDNGKKKTIVIDPLDGSDNFKSNIPYYGSSIALCNENLDAEVGIIINLCNADFIIGKQSMVYMGNLYQNQGLKYIKSRATKCGIFERAYMHPEICKFLENSKIKFRSLGALALSIGLSHQVNFVLFPNDIRRFDVKAGMLLAKGLHKFENQKFILISKDKDLLDRISEFLI